MTQWGIDTDPFTYVGGAHLHYMASLSFWGLMAGSVELKVLRIKTFINVQYRSRYSDGLQAEWQGFDSRQGKTFFFTPAFRLALGPPSLLYKGYQRHFAWG
jgi:hypothetical protein